VLPVAPGVEPAECVGGEATEVVVTPAPDSAAVSYTLDPVGGVYDVSAAAVTVTVTAELASDYVWGELAGPWTLTDPEDPTSPATMPIELAQLACTDESSTSSSTVPGGATTQPGGATTTPGGATTTPGGVTTQPGGVTTTPGGVTTTVPGGPTTAPAAPANVVVSGNAVCAPDAGQTTLTWTVRNTGGSPVTITGDDRGVSFTPTQLPANTSATGSEVIEGPAADEAVTETVNVDVGGGQTAEAGATVTVPACTGPAAPDDIVFAFTNEASVAEATSGETIAYDYCGENTSDVDLEVVQVVDDRYGVLELPAGEYVVAPGETICSSDLGLPVTHVPTAAEEGTTIVNNAVATVRTVEPEPRTFQATDPAEVEILGFQSPEQAASTTTTLPVTALANTGSNSVAQVIAGALALAGGGLLLLIGRRRTT
jgi:LPXTG-motif cell wall-anchored protein